MKKEDLFFSNELQKSQNYNKVITIVRNIFADDAKEFSTNPIQANGQDDF